MSPAETERIKDLLPTELGSAEIREQIARDILRRSVFSARMASATYLAKVREVCAQMLDGTISQADARNTLEGVLEQMGHSMNDDGGLTNPMSIRRLDLILETQTQMAASVAQLEEQTDAVLEEWPAWELMRLEDRSAPRPDWAARWNLAGQSVGWKGALETHIGGRMIALKNSPIWQALGDGVGGFKDTLGNPYPPFAYSSGMGWQDVTAEECERLGLTDGAGRSGIAPYPTDGGRGERPARPSPDPTDGGRGERPARPSLSPDLAQLKEAAERYGFDFSKGLI